MASSTPGHDLTAGAGADRAALLASGHAYVDLSFWRKTAVRGPDASTWLNDLISADLSGLQPGWARQSLLLSPTGQVRAAFTVAARDDGYLLLQDPIQPGRVGDLLARYVLSSDVSLEDRTAEVSLFALPGADVAVEAEGATSSVPSCLTSGVDLLAPAAAHDAVEAELAGRFQAVGDEDLEVWRIRASLTRLGVDVGPDDLPQEGAMDGAVAHAKGCYLGQEAVARTRNLGHPRRLLLPLAAIRPVSPGDVVEVDGREVGQVTSVAPNAPGTPGVVLMARVRWDGREGPFRTRTGVDLLRRS